MYFLRLNLKGKLSAGKAEMGASGDGILVTFSGKTGVAPSVSDATAVCSCPVQHCAFVICSKNISSLKSMVNINYIEATEITITRTDFGRACMNTVFSTHKRSGNCIFSQQDNVDTIRTR